MERHFEKSLDKIGRTLKEMTSLCRESLAAAARAFTEGNPQAAEPAFLNERRINQLEIAIEHEVVDTFALYQPVAVDLRFLIAILKINNDLERIGDHTVNIAQSSISSIAQPLPTRLELPRMFELTQTMLGDACRGFFEKDLGTARTVLEADDLVDGINRATVREAVSMVKGNSMTIETALELMRIARNLERIADLSTNIAEEVIFHVQAKVVKHQGDEKN